MDTENQAVGRSYTRARRLPWVVGKIQGVALPFGPYTATQLGILLAGGWLLVQTFRFWTHMGPAALVVLALPPAAAWAVRHAKIEGRSPVRAVSGYLALLAEPRAGRIGGKPARQPRPASFTGRIRIARPNAAPPPQPDSGPSAPVPSPTALQAMLANRRG